MLPLRRLLVAFAFALCALGALGGCPSARAPIPLTPALEEAFKARHADVYGVYDLGLDKGAIHDHLARAFRGEALTREYVEQFATAMRLNAEGTRVEVLEVSHEAIEAIAAAKDRPRLLVRWTVRGVVTHRGHSHVRSNRYAAVFTLEGEGDELRIVDTRMKELERVVDPRNEALEFARSREAEGGGRSILELIREGATDE